MIFLSLFRDKIYFKFKFCIKLQENNANLHCTDFKITQLVHIMITDHPVDRRITLILSFDNGSLVNFTNISEVVAAG